MAAAQGQPELNVLDRIRLLGDAMHAFVSAAEFDRWVDPHAMLGP